MCRKITSHWQPLFSKKMAAAAASFSYKIGGRLAVASFSYKIGGGSLIFLQNWRAAAMIWQHYWRLFWHGLDIGPSFSSLHGYLLNKVIQYN